MSFRHHLTDRSAPFGRQELLDEETHTGEDPTRLGEQQHHAGGARSAVGIQNLCPPRRNESQTVSQYFTMIAFLLMIMSPPLIPALVSIVHRIVGAVRAVVGWGSARPAASRA